MDLNLLLLWLWLTPFTISLPTGCTYDTDEKLYTCDARLWSLPLQYSDFNTGEPQRILLQNVAGNIATNTFSGFSSINTANFDSRFVPSLYIMCYANSDVIIDGAAFTDFSYIDEVQIVDCNILSLPAEVFKYFGDVNSFHIRGGSIDNMNYDALRGLNVLSMKQYPNPLGEFGIVNCELTDGALAFGVLFSISASERIRIESAHMTSTQVDMFNALDKMTFLSLSHNPFTLLEDNMLEGPSSLSTIELNGIQWECSCQNLWFIAFVKDNNITLLGDIVCATPASAAGQRLETYHQANCVAFNPCHGKSGVVSGGRCMSTTEIFIYSITPFVIGIATFTFVLVVIDYRKLKIAQVQPESDPEKKGERKKRKSRRRKGDDDVDDGEPKPNGRKLSGSAWKNVAGPKSERSFIDDEELDVVDNRRNSRYKAAVNKVINVRRFMTPAEAMNF